MTSIKQNTQPGTEFSRSNIVRYSAVYALFAVVFEYGEYCDYGTRGLVTGTTCTSQRIQIFSFYVALVSMKGDTLQELGLDFWRTREI